MSSYATGYQELNVLKLFLQGKPLGASIEEIEHHAGLNLHRRTLQRRLSTLEVNGEIIVNGRGRSIRYCLAPFNPQAHVPTTKSRTNLTASLRTHLPTIALAVENPIPLSLQAEKVLPLIDRPLSFRTPISYQKEFLENYQPNTTFYLSSTEREKLAILGKTTVVEEPAGTHAKHILNRLLIDLSWNSSRLEGNTYSLLDTQRLIEFGQTAEGKNATDAQMILNHKAAIEFLVQSAEEATFNRHTILNLHALLANNLLLSPQAVGRLRYMGVGITGSAYEPLHVPQRISEYFDLLLEKASLIKNPFEQAFFVMVHIPYLQPFDDVNKRVSRLAANIPLLKHNLSPLSFVDVPEKLYIQGLLGIYELNSIALMKDVFLWAYERSAARYAAIRQLIGNPDLFRMRYWEEIHALISDIVSNNDTHEETLRKIKNKTQTLPVEDQSRFIEVVETELMSLHEGNFARYRISQEAFKRWCRS
jgi:hypothetical protein